MREGRSHAITWGRDLPENSKCKIPEIERFLVRTMAFTLSEVRSHWRVLSEGTVVSLCLIK